MKTIAILGSAAITAALLFSIGCADTSARLVPASASVVGSGSGQITYLTSDHGTIYVYDRTSNRLIYSGEVMPNQSVLVDPSNNRVMIGQRVAVQLPLSSVDQYQIFLDRNLSDHVVREEHRETIDHEASEH